MVASIGSKSNFYFRTTSLPRVRCQHDNTSCVSLTLTTQVNDCDDCGEEVTTQSFLTWEDVVLADGTTVFVTEDRGDTLTVEIDRERSAFLVFPILASVRRSQIVALAGTAYRGQVDRMAV